MSETSDGSPTFATRQDDEEQAPELPLCDDALHVAVRRREWSWIRRLLRRSDALRLVRFHDRYAPGPPRHGTCRNSSLDLVCKSNAPVDIVERVVRLDGGAAAHRRNHSNYTPLYYACGCASEGIVALLLDAAPETAAVTNYYGRSPLHEAISSRRSAGIVRRLLTVHPTAVYAAECRYTPLKLFMDRTRHHPTTTTHQQCHYFTETLYLLLTAHVHGTLDIAHPQRTIQSWLPLHEALKINNVAVPSQFLRVLNDTLHLRCIRPDRERNFPMHLACTKIFVSR